MLLIIPQTLPAYKALEEEKRVVMHRARHDAGHPPAAHPAGEPDADENRHRNADRPHAVNTAPCRWS